MIPSKFQENIYSWIENQTGHGSIIAVAGSGKTTTAEECIKKISFMENILFSTFTNVIADAAKRKFTQENIKISTLNSLGWGACLSANRGHKIVLQQDKTEKILRFKIFPNKGGELSGADEKWIRKYGYSITRLVSLLKGACIFTIKGATQYLDELLAFHDIETPDKESDYNRFVNILLDTFKASINSVYFYDFDDQIYQPLKNDWDLRKYDWVFVDEFQDLNIMKEKIATKSLRSGGRMVIIGDPYQAIYEFTGSMPDMMANWSIKMNARELPLSVCYRCPQSVIRLAKEIVNHIEPAPGAIEGSVQVIKQKQLLEFIKPGAFVLCRTTAPLVKQCLHFIRAGINAYVKGQDSGLMGLVRMICSDGPMQIVDFSVKLTAYYLERSENLRRLNRIAALESLQNKYEILQVLCEGICYSSDLPAMIDTVYSEKQNAICCMTSHKSKGLQNPNVFVLKPHQLDDNWRATKPWMPAAQRRLRYVTFTRSQENLFLVNEDD